jgi:hypothetical protein
MRANGLSGLWPGGVVLSKAARPKSVAQVSQACFQPPAARSATGRGSEKPNLRATTMTTKPPGADSARPVDSISRKAATPAPEPEKRTSESRNAKPLVRVRGLYYPTDHTPEEIFQAIAKLRKEAADEIDRLLAFLDETGPDCDDDSGIDDGPMDEDELEPSLGSLNTFSQVERFLWAGVQDDLEACGSDREGCESEREISDLEYYGESDEDCGAEPSLVSADGTAMFSPNFPTDGEKGGLSVAELDRLRAKRCPQRPPQEKPERVGDDPRLVMVTRRAAGTICNVRPLTPEEQARYLGSVGAPGSSVDHPMAVR